MKPNLLFSRSSTKGNQTVRFVKDYDDVKRGTICSADIVSCFRRNAPYLVALVKEGAVKEGSREYCVNIDCVEVVDVNVPLGV